METDIYSPLLCTVSPVFLLAHQQVLGSVFTYQSQVKQLKSVVHLQMKLPQYAVLLYHWPAQKSCKIFERSTIYKLQHCDETIKHIGTGVISTWFILVICTVRGGHVQTQTCNITVVLAVRLLCLWSSPGNTTSFVQNL